MKIKSVAVFGSLTTALLVAQEFRGTFSGTVTDAQGAGIAKAKVVATETSTGSKSDTRLGNDRGVHYPIPQARRIPAEAPGFKKFVYQML
jgi:hypothetical protein